ncbi:kinase-like protein [Aureobasidium pullulans]|uniref:EKC/KEOPS complex subunit BUD32 n=1 Tax=Aureobasidium pullulans TaxID=5580 RepID=A0A4S9CB12_AURPU|nr:kinase-like protein [Aureobasidium pullulans]
MAAPARSPIPLIPTIDIQAFGNLLKGAQDKLIDTFLRWGFVRPTVPSATHALNQGRWLPIQPRNISGEDPLAEGGSGIVHLWCCLDARDRIIDRVIVKENVPGLTEWNGVDIWRNGQVGTEPREHEISVDLFTRLQAANAGDGKFMVECLGYGDLRGPYGTNTQGQPIAQAFANQPAVSVARFKLYLEYCPYGDLYYLIRRHKAANKLFEEGFIWMMFEALAKCAIEMEHANFVHGDMSTSNILLGTHDPQRFKIWPVPKLADFGGSRYLTAGAILRNNNALLEPMQPDFGSPELSKSVGGWEVPGLTLSAKTNVWNVGLLICCLMRLEPVLPDTEWRFTNTPPVLVPPAHHYLQFANPQQRELLPANFQHPRANYSQALRDLARDCMRYDPNNRPTPTVLLQRVTTDMVGNTGGFDTFTGGVSGRIAWNKKERILGPRVDEWAIGTQSVIYLAPL